MPAVLSETSVMGRPPLQVRKTTVRLPENVFERITKLVGERRMAEFIRDAVVSELERREADAAQSGAKASAEPPLD